MNSGKQWLSRLLPVAWPVGMRLRFKRNAVMRLPRYLYLRGTPVLILSGLVFRECDNEPRQYVAAFGAQCDKDHFGWARPEQLEIIPGDDDLLRRVERTAVSTNPSERVHLSVSPG